MPPLHPALHSIVRTWQADQRERSAPPALAERRAAHEWQVETYTPPHVRPSDVTATDVVVDSDGPPLRLRVYRPLSRPASVDHAGTRPTVVWFHGGGWTTGSLRTADVAAREVCAAGTVVVSVDYRLAPEHPFPAAVEDCRRALRWTVDRISELGGDGRRVAVGGDSAGGNLAAVIALESRVADVAVAGQLLLYPVTDLDRLAAHASRRTHADGPVLTVTDLHWLFEQYMSGGADPHDPALSPLRTPDLAGAPPAVVVTVECDPLRSEGRSYAEALRLAGVPVVHLDGAGLVHGVFDMVGACPPARDLLRQAVAHLLALL